MLIFISTEEIVFEEWMDITKVIDVVEGGLNDCFVWMRIVFWEDCSVCELWRGENLSRVRGNLW